MTRVTLTLHDDVSTAVRTAIGAADEIAGVLIVGKMETGDELRLLGREFIPAPAEAYAEQTPRRLNLTWPAWMPALSRAAAAGASALLVHSHPEDAPEMSSLDDGVDEQLRSVFQIRTASELYGSLVLRLVDGELGFSGRIWRGEEQISSIELLREIGQRFRFTAATDATDPVPASAIFDRQVLAFGEAMQQLLSRLHIGIVGCGGTGSAVAEQLIRLGVGRLTAIDEQVLADTNVTRVYGSGFDDVDDPKVEIVKRSAARIGLPTTVKTIKGSVTRLEVAWALADCDIVFACTDDHAGRGVLARIAYWLVIPVIDLGAKILNDGDLLKDVVTRVNIQVPGSACAYCARVIDPARALAELMTPEQLRAAQRDGYAPTLDTRDPAVVAYTTLVASLGVHEMLARMTGLSAINPDEVVFKAATREVLRFSRRPNEGHWCNSPEIWGTGETRRFLDQAWPA